MDYSDSKKLDLAKKIYLYLGAIFIIIGISLSNKKTKLN